MSILKIKNESGKWVYIPTIKGDKGDKGDPGAKGDTGSKGDKGDPGEKGDTGATGPKGDTGATGPKGDTGAKGDKGDTGADGYSPTAKVEAVSNGAKITITDKTGTTSVTVTNGSKGDKGDKGDTGETGATGPKGDTGADGFSPSASVTQTASGATISITDKNGTTTANISNGTNGSPGAKGDPGDDYVLTAQDKTDIAEIVAENGLFYETHCNGQVFNVSNPGASWVNTDGTMSGLQVRRYVFDADGAQDVVQLSRVYDSSVEAYCFTGTSETLGITLTYYHSNTLINQSHIEFSSNVTKFKMYIYSATALVELKTGHDIGRVFANKILSLIDDYYDNGDTSYYG